MCIHYRGRFSDYFWPFFSWVEMPWILFICLFLLYFRNMKILTELYLFHFLGIDIVIIHEIEI